MKRIDFIIGTLLLFLWSCRQPAPEHTIGDATRVRVVEVRPDRISLPVIASGLVVPAQEIKLAFKTGGIIAGIYATEGTRVRRGDLLATLNLTEVEAQVQQYTNGYEKALRDYNRAKNLFADSVATLEQLQNAETALNVSKAGLDAALFNLEHSRIVAPEQGTILKQLAEANEVIAPGYPVFLFGSSGSGWKIRAGLSDRDFVRISPGDSARATTDAYPGTIFKAVVNQISEAANPLTGTYEIELNLLSVRHKLAAGFVVDLEIFPGQADSCIYIPVQALVEMDGSSGYVYRVNDSMKAEKVKVNIVRIVQSSLAAISDPDLSGRIITEGATYVSDGDAVILAD